MTDKIQLINYFNTIRNYTEALCQPLAIEDYVIQSSDDVSPVKWHLAHTSWVFESFILNNKVNGYNFFHPHFDSIFNSYYQGTGSLYPRGQRGFLSRPTVGMIYTYRKYINNQITNLIENSNVEELKEIESLIILGLQHEQQHQELLLMDIKFNFSHDPSFPIYSYSNMSDNTPAKELFFIPCHGGVIEIGHAKQGFCYDNELPCHQKIVKPFLMANRLITNKEYLEFMDDNGYNNPSLWLADGWQQMKKNGWHAPLYWIKMDNAWFIFTLRGLEKLKLDEPVSHISFYEANAFARWKNKRLPTEEEWEHFVNSSQITIEDCNFLENKIFHPQASSSTVKPVQFFGDLWEWTESPYVAYPGYKPLEGFDSEENSKFMCNQIVLRGGSCITPQSHIRSTYRKYYHPEKRWQFSGIRLASEP